MKTASVISWIFGKVGVEETKIIAIRFMCIPGVRPVSVPAIKPMRRAKISSIIIII